MTSIFGMWLAYEAGSLVGRVRRNRIETEDDKRKVAAAMLRSPVVQELLAQGHSCDEVLELLDFPRLRGREFERVLGVPWPL